MPTRHSSAPDDENARPCHRCVEARANRLARRLVKEVEHTVQVLFQYALLAVVTETPYDRALAYLKDTGSPESARGRLLLRAAERSFREQGDGDEPGYHRG